MRTIGFILILQLLFTTYASAQTSVTQAEDSIAAVPDSAAGSPYRFRPLQLAVPLTLIGVGVVGLESDWLQGQDSEIRDELQEHSHSKVTVDDFTQYAPLAATYGLRLAGVRSQHGYRDMTLIAATSYLLTGISVYAIKTATKVQRPDGSTRNSFPSGHTATAFAGAELLRREYWRTSPWIGVAGYAVAAGTGFMRMYNNRHWLTDVLAGAGVGILSVEAAYWLYPAMSRLLFRRHGAGGGGVVMVPYVSRGAGGVSCAVTF